MADKPIVNIGILGLGVVGQGVLKHLNRNRKLLESRLGVRLNISKIAVRNKQLKRGIKVDPLILTEDGFEVVNDPSIQIVCELIGGTKIAKELTLQALKNGKSVVTANKALLCEYGNQIIRAAKSSKGHLFFEASVAGGIPIIKSIREGLVANRFPQIRGILNGTCNYILTRMQAEGKSFGEILAEAKSLGYAEADESLDVDGIDAAHKAGILAYLAHGKWIPMKQMLIEGIREVTTGDMVVADAMGYRIKHLASIECDSKKNRLFVGAYPALVSKSHILGRVDDVYNAVCVSGDVVGTTVHIGRGAGEDATASAVIGDIADAVFANQGTKFMNLIDDQNDPLASSVEPLQIAKLEEVSSCFYLRLTVVDQPGVLSKLTAVMAKEKISIARVSQELDPEFGSKEKRGSATLILTTHECSESAIANAVRALKRMGPVLSKPFLLRIVEFKD
ncbi:MAG: homoserine dehydrogenase [Verrucomicrobia bacterium]|nr:homoserine dehydrogenase [Verrucomicrobiota bacterium]MDA1067943.1 homoserine dehydrogenase [Verrucomicrobiota bacterium]